MICQGFLLMALFIGLFDFDEVKSVVSFVGSIVGLSGEVIINTDGSLLIAIGNGLLFGVFEITCRMSC